MIVSWKKVSALEFVARWEGKDFQLIWSPAEHRWEVWVDGARTNRRFISAATAMDAVEDSLNRKLVELGRFVQATQRPSSFTRITHVARNVEVAVGQLTARKRRAVQGGPSARV